MNDDWEESWENHYVRYDNSEYSRSSLTSQFDSYSDNNYQDYYEDYSNNNTNNKRWDWTEDDEFLNWLRSLTII